MRPTAIYLAMLLFCVIGLSTSNAISTGNPPPADQPRTGAREAPPPPAGTLPADWVDALHWRCIGPANMGGRITAIAVCEADPSTWWAATASGGLLKTTNNGITFEHQFDRERTVSIGDIAVAPSDANIVWVGTGESNPRNSVSWGNGVYKSVDGGQSWQHMGLDDSFQIGRIAIHPNNPDIVYVGALGRLWGPNEQRGLFKTTDGGKTWEKILYIDDQTGVVDVQMHPTDSNTLLVATYERQRDEFDSNDPAKKWGPGSGLHKTTDGGKTWKRITDGLPSCNLGRIGIDYYRADPDIVYLVLESERIAQEPPDAAYMGIRGEDADVGARLTEIIPGGPAEKAELHVGDIVVAVNDTTIHSYQDLVKQIRLRLAGDTVNLEVSRDRKSVFVELTFMKHPRPTGQRHRQPFGAGLGGQRENLQEQQGPEGHEYGGVYQSTDGGASWTRINSVNPRPMYFSQIRADPSDNNHLYVLGIDLHRSQDGGATFTPDGARHVHVDHHALWIDPQDGRHMILGNDGGIYVTYDRGENWDRLDHVAIGQFYHVTVDGRRNYNVYGGLQDNGSWGGPNRARSGPGPRNADWFMLGWGDGFICRVDADDPDQVYFESQNGSLGRYNLRSAERGFIRPRSPAGKRYRFNWKTPYILSHHNARILYLGGNYLFRSLAQGEKLKRISPEISRTRDGSATALAESPLDADVLYVGSDDGLLWVTRDGGHEWRKLVDFPVEHSVLGKVKIAGRAIWRHLISAAPTASQPSSAPTTKPATQPASSPLPTTKPAKPPKNGGQAAARSEGTPPPPASQPQTRPTDTRPATSRPAEESPRLITRPQATAIEDRLAGLWTGQVSGAELPAEQVEFTLHLELEPHGQVTGTLSSPMGEGDVVEARFNPLTNRLTGLLDMGYDMVFDIEATLSRGQLSGSITMGGAGLALDFRATQAEQAEPDAERIAEAYHPLSELVPGPRRVSSLETSRAGPGRVYLTLDGHRSDDDQPYVFVSEDYGETWRSLRANLPGWAGSTRVIREDLENPDLLYLGTEFGAWVSVDRGQSWTTLNSNLPTVAVHEFAIHPTAGEIVAATHGRSLWILDVTPLRQMSPETVSASAYLYEPGSAIYWRPELPRGGDGARQYAGENPPECAQIYYSLQQRARKISLEITDLAGETIRTLEASPEPGLHCVSWDLRLAVDDPDDGRRAGPLAPAGRYLVRLTVDRRTFTEELTVETDPDYPDYHAWESATQETMKTHSYDEPDVDAAD